MQKDIFSLSSSLPAILSDKQWERYPGMRIKKWCCGWCQWNWRSREGANGAITVEGHVRLHFSWRVEMPLACSSEWKWFIRVNLYEAFTRESLASHSEGQDLSVESLVPGAWWLAAKALRWDSRLVHTFSELPSHSLFLFAFSLPAIIFFSFTCNEEESHIAFSW